MRIIFIVTCLLCTISFSKAYAVDENLDFMRITVPLGWEVAESDESKVILKETTSCTTFIYKKIPVHYVTLEEYSRALMKAYGGYNFTKRTDSIYYFEYLHGSKYAWTLVSYYKGNNNILCTQTGIGESSDFIPIMESISLK